MYAPTKRRELGAALGAAFLAGSWTPEELLARGSSSLGVRPHWLRAVVSEVLDAYPRAPLDRARELAAYIELRLAERRSSFPAPQIVRWLDFEPAMGRTRWPVIPIASPAELAERLELDAGQLAWLADARGLERTAGDARLRNYRYRWHHRQHAPRRLIEQPKARLKQVQRWILREMLDAIPGHDAAHGFTRGRSARTHAALHTGRPVVVRFDIEDFFAGVTAGRVHGTLRAAGYPEAVAYLLTGLCVNVLPGPEWEALPPPRDAALLPRHHRLGRRLAAPHLPQGAPTSPALASLATFGLDVRLSALAAALDLTYSRYADDLTFSGARDGIATLRAAIPAIVRDEGLRVNAGKTRIRSQASRQLVGGSVVNRHVNVPRHDYDRLKAILHDATRHGPAAANRGGVEDFRAHLLGHIGWVAALNPERGRRLRQRFNSIQW